MRLGILLTLYILSFKAQAVTCEVNEVGLTAEDQEVIGLASSMQSISEPDRCSLGLHYDEENPQIFETIKAGLESRGYTVTRYDSQNSRSTYFSLFPSVRCQNDYEKCWVRLGLNIFNNPMQSDRDEVDYPSLNLSYDFEIDPEDGEQVHSQEVLESLDRKTRRKFLKCNSLHRIMNSARTAESHLEHYDRSTTIRVRQAAMRCRIIKSFHGFDPPVCN